MCEDRIVPDGMGWARTLIKAQREQHSLEYYFRLEEERLERQENLKEVQDV